MCGRYVIGRLIARGGMGEVYRARDRVLRRDVAIKVVRGLADSNARERFNREAYLAARIDHPNVVRIFDLGACDDGCPFLVMELLCGRGLTELLAEGPLAIARVVRLLEGIADALDAIHDRGVVHRDIKLDNLMVIEQEGAAARTKLLDFGIAVAPTDDVPRLTVEGTLVGTPLYAAPEVLLGGIPTPRSDVYSLAATAYKLLTGVAPFELMVPTQMIQAKVCGPPPAPSTYRRTLPPAIDVLFSHALSLDPADRPERASSLIARLREAGRPAPPRAPRRRWPLFLTGGVAAFLLALVVVLIAGAHARW